MTPKEVAGQWFERIWNQHDAKAIYELMHPEASGTSEAGAVRGPEQFERNVFVPLLQAFPDIQVEIEGMVADGGEVVVRWRAIGTNSGPMGPKEPSGRRVAFSGMSWLRIDGDQVVEGADRYNLHGVLACLECGEQTTTIEVLA